MKERIILAWDRTSWSQEDQALLSLLIPQVGVVKLGLATITASYHDSSLAHVIKEFVHERRGRIFWDIKLNDIPITTENAVKNIADSKVWAFSIHASSGAQSIRAAQRNKGDSLLFGVTTLTSLSKSDAKYIFNQKTSEEAALHLAHILMDNGADGIICSEYELEIFQDNELTKKILTIVPGIRPIWAKNNDQKRTATPSEAIRKGADYIVVGRPILSPPQGVSSSEAIAKIIREISEV